MTQRDPAYDIACSHHYNGLRFYNIHVISIITCHFPRKSLLWFSSHDLWSLKENLLCGMLWISWMRVSHLYSASSFFSLELLQPPFLPFVSVLEYLDQNILTTCNYNWRAWSHLFFKKKKLKQARCSAA